MSNTIHESLVSTEDSSITIETSADVIKPIFGYVSKLVDEIKLNISEDEMSFAAVDPANVAMTGLDVPSEAFETFDVEETTLGVDTSSMMGSLRAGRQSNEDPITLSVEGNRVSTVVQRDYDGTHMDLQSDLRVIDPDSIRQEPEIPDIGLEKEATVPRKLFEDVVKQVDAYSDYLQIKSDDTNLVFNARNAPEGTKAVIPDVMEDSEGEGNSSLSLDYVKKDAVKAFKAIGTDELTFSFGVEFPVRIEFTTELNGTEVTGWWFQAPRIQSD